MVGWPAEAEVPANVTAPSEGAFGALFTWSSEAQQFRRLEVPFTWDEQLQHFKRFSRDAPASVNTATGLRFGEGVWVQLSAAAVWNQPSP